MKNYGPVSIGTNIERTNSVDNRHVIIGIPIEPKESASKAADKTDSDRTSGHSSLPNVSLIRLRSRKANKVNFIRVIKAMHKEGFFESIDGGTPTEDQVFAAFGFAVNGSLDDFKEQLANNRKNNLPSTRATIFNTLHDTYQAYEQDLDDRKAERSLD